MGKAYKAGFIQLFLLIIGSAAFGQNLVRNGNFEEFANFRDFDFGYKSLENNVTHLEKSNSSKPSLFSDEKTAKSGLMFAGLHVYGKRNYREYISSPLNCRLIAGRMYVFRMYVKLSSNSEFALSSFGASFTTEKPDMSTDGVLLDTPQVFVDNKAFFGDTRAWILVEDSFVAKGNESFVTIGNFLNDENSISKKVVRMAKEGRAYYYIDDIALYSKDGHDPCRAVRDSFDCDSFSLSEENLLADPSFECYNECPSNVNTTKLHQLDHWDQTAGTPDYYNSCSIIMSTPDNIMGNEDARTGFGYVGMYLFDQGNYREFLTAPLTEPLEKEKWYVIKLYAALSENSGLATDAFEFLLTNKFPSFSSIDSADVKDIDPNDTAAIRKLEQEILEKDSSTLSKLSPQVINEPGNYADRYTWKKICGMYLAEGGERFITMGNFNTDRGTPLKVINDKGGGFSYYFIDDFTIEPLNDSNMTECGAGVPVADDEEELVTTRYFQDLDLPELLNDEPFSFRGFYFEFDKYDILDTNYFFLDSLVDLLIENPDLSLEVEGHTDDVGSKSYNEKLSKNRALAVVNYLIAEGVDKKRIKYSYFGATKPIGTNGSQEGRQLNRRCEFLLKR